MKKFNTLLITEFRLSLRDMNMLIFAIIMPLIVLAAIGMIYGEKLAFEGASYTFLEQSFGGIATIAICAGGVMGLPLVISDYRGKKILKRFKVTPVSPSLLLLVQVAVYAIYAALSLILIWIVAKIFFAFHMRGSVTNFLLGWLLVLVSMFSIGVLVGGLAKNTKVAGIIASILYFPMLVFSGATLPYEVMPKGVQKISDIMPLTSGVKIIKSAVLGVEVEGTGISVIVMAIIAVVCIICSIRFFKWE